VARQVQGRLRERLPDRERRANGGFHARVHVGRMSRIGADERGREVARERGLDALHRLVGPRLHRHRLAPALGPALIGRAHHDRGAPARLEKLELADQRVVEPADVDALDLGHSRLTIRLKV
jgi:hypothetical protein